jgi:hypothetical protein
VSIYTFFPDLFLVVLHANCVLYLSSSDDDDVPLAKRAKLVSERAASAKESGPSPAKTTPPGRMAVEKIPMSKVIPPSDPPASLASRDHVSFHVALFC